MTIHQQTEWFDFTPNVTRLDQLVIDGNASLAGTLLADRLDPLLGTHNSGSAPYLDELEILQATLISGQFDAIEKSISIRFTATPVQYESTRVFATIALLGDANLNQQVEQGDLDAVLGNWGQTGQTWVTGDFTGDGVVNQGDLDAVLTNWGSSAAQASRGSWCPSRRRGWCWFWRAARRAANVARRSYDRGPRNPSRKASTMQMNFNPLAHLPQGVPNMSFVPGVNQLDPRLDPSRPVSAPPIGRYREMTIDELLLENRVIFLVGEIHHGSAMGVVMRLLHLANTKPGQDINLYINSPGGSVDDTLAMIDTMNFLPCDVATYCIGKAMSGGALTLAAGTKGKRYCLPHAKVMIHQPYGGIYGQTTDVQIQAEEILKTKAELNEMLAGYTGQPLEKLTEDSERDKFFSAQEAKEYGLVDEVITQQQPVKKDTAPTE